MSEIVRESDLIRMDALVQEERDRIAHHQLQIENIKKRLEMLQKKRDEIHAALRFNGGVLKVNRDSIDEKDVRRAAKKWEDRK